MSDPYAQAVAGPRSVLQRASILSELAAMTRAEQRQLHASGACPDVQTLSGRAEGLILSHGGAAWLRLWRGKVFYREGAGLVGGFNLLGIGPLVFRRYRFRASVTRSAFSTRDVVFIDHDLPGNPHWVRRFHDELVEVVPGLYLATSHLHVGDSLRFLSCFALDFRGAS